MITARKLAQDSRHIAQEFAEMMVLTGNSQVFLDQLVHMLPDLAAHPRIRFMEAAALCELGRTNEARLIIGQSFVMPDIREGEISLADLWMKINQMENGEEENAAPPLPYHLDFRMN